MNGSSHEACVYESSSVTEVDEPCASQTEKGEKVRGRARGTAWMVMSVCAVTADGDYDGTRTAMRIVADDRCGMVELVGMPPACIRNRHVNFSGG